MKYFYPRKKTKTTKSGISGFLLILFLSVFFIFSNSESVSAKPLFQSPDKNFTVYDRGNGFIRRNAHSKLYISIKFDLVIRDENILSEPEGIQTYHIAHYNDAKVKGYINALTQDFYKIYVQCRKDITEEIHKTSEKISLIKIEQNSDQGDEVKLTPGEEAEFRRIKPFPTGLNDKEKKEYQKWETEYKRKWKRWKSLKKLSDDLTDFYHNKTKELVNKLTYMHNRICRTSEYINAMKKNASYKVARGRIIDIGSGVFALSGSVTRVVYGDIGSIFSGLHEIADLTHSLYDTFRKSNPDELVEMYDELAECIDSLKNSNDPASIRSKLSLLEKSYDSYLVKKNKFIPADIDKTIELQQFSTQIDDIERNLGEIMTSTKITGNSIKEFNSIQRKLRKLKNETDIRKKLSQELIEAFNDSKSLMVEKPMLKSQKEMELKRLVETTKSKSKRVGKSIESYVLNFIDITENIISTLTQIYDIGISDLKK